MSLVGLLIVLILASVLIWAGNQLITEPKFNQIFRVIVVVFIVIWILQSIGGLGFIGAGPVIRVN